MPGARRIGSPSTPLSVVLAIVILLIGGWVGFSQLSAKFSDRLESFYPSLADADKDGAITRGWIPDDLLPTSSRDIHEVHDLSPSREWCAFQFASDDSEKLRKTLKRIDVLPPPVRHVRDPKVAWWPAVLKGDLDAREIRNRGWDLYVTERPASPVQRFVLLFAVDWSKGRAFFYSTYK